MDGWVGYDERYITTPSIAVRARRSYTNWNQVDVEKRGFPQISERCVCGGVLELEKMVRG